MPPEGYGKFELNVHSNDCYTAERSEQAHRLPHHDRHHGHGGRPTRSSSSTAASTPTATTPPTGTSYPSLLSVTSTTLTPDADGTVGVQVTCGTGSKGCSGTLAATAGGTGLGSIPFTLPEEQTARLTLPGPVPATADQVGLTVTTTDAVGPTSTVTLPVQR